jgi:hypothetical protein
MLWGGSALCCICRRLEIPSHVLGTCSIFDMIGDGSSCSFVIIDGCDVRLFPCNRNERLAHSSTVHQ